LCESCSPSMENPFCILMCAICSLVSRFEFPDSFAVSCFPIDFALPRPIFVFSHMFSPVLARLLCAPDLARRSWILPSPGSGQILLRSGASQACDIFISVPRLSQAETVFRVGIFSRTGFSSPVIFPSRRFSRVWSDLPL
jgi:hypothetical protein